MLLQHIAQNDATYPGLLCERTADVGSAWSRGHFCCLHFWPTDKTTAHINSAKENCNIILPLRTPVRYRGAIVCILVCFNQSTQVD